MDHGEVASAFRDQVGDLVGEANARRFARLKWFELAASLSWAILIPVGLVFALRPHHSVLLAAVIGFGSAAVAGSIGYGVSGLIFLRSIAREFGYSTWWCVKYVTLDPAHLIEFLNDEMLARGGTTPTSVARNLDRELESEDRARAHARVARRRALWFQVAALILNLVTVIHGLRSYGSVSSQLSLQPPGFTPDGQDQLLAAIDCVTSPTSAPSSLSVTGEAFTCTSLDGGVVTFSYFATQQNARTWLRKAVTAQHLPDRDALLGDLWAVVTADESVRSRVRGIGGQTI